MPEGGNDGAAHAHHVPFILLVSLAALVMGMLNAKSIFGRPAMASSFFNLGSIIGGVSLGWMIDPHFGPERSSGSRLAR